MPSPFPGMDPYLEENSWLSFHAALTVEIARQLVPLLQPRYLAFNDRYFINAAPDDPAVPHVCVEIRTIPKRELVSVIEVLTGVTKLGAGRGQYLQRRHRIQESGVHLVEIDLLRRGERLVPTERLPHASYFVIRSRANQPTFAEVWSIRLVDRLPVIPIPLQVGDSDVPLDLQVALAGVYDALRWDLQIDYTKPPTVPLPAEAVPWASELLRGHRPRTD